MTSSDIGMVNSFYSIGGFCSALLAGPIADKLGRRRASFINCIFLALGSFFISSSFTVFQMSVGRFLAGLGAGAAIVVGPMYYSEISPAKYRGFIGGISQILVNTGIFISQLLGVFLSTDTRWRYILYVGVLVAVVNGALLPICVESPKWLALHGMIPEAKANLIKLRPPNWDVDDELASWKLAALSDARQSIGQEADSLLTADSSSSDDSKKVTPYVFLTDVIYRKSMIACAGIMVFQQLSGINSIVFYGSAVLKDALPNLSSVVSCLISLLNLIVTIIVTPLIDKYGRKNLLLISSLGMTVWSAALAIGMMKDLAITASISAALFVFSFALGIGPIPFLIVSELVPHAAVGVAQSVATTANWLTTFIIAYFFPICQNLLKDKVFFIFSITGVLGILFIQTYIPETHGKSYSQIWR